MISNAEGNEHHFEMKYDERRAAFSQLDSRLETNLRSGSHCGRFTAYR